MPSHLQFDYGVLEAAGHGGMAAPEANWNA